MSLISLLLTKAVLALVQNNPQKPPDLTFLGKLSIQRLVILAFHFFQKRYAILTK